MKKKKKDDDWEIDFSPSALSRSVIDEMRRDMLRYATVSIAPSMGFPSSMLPVAFEKAPPFDKSKLEALKAAEPIRVEQRVPDMVEVITAWRAWGTTTENGEWRLKALGQSHTWQPRQQVNAVCEGSILSRGKHPAPSFDCTCGVWAFKSLDGLVAALGSYSDVRVLGTVSLWGRVIETENGYRAQHAYPSELWLLDNSIRDVGYIYDVPVRIVD